MDIYRKIPCLATSLFLQIFTSKPPPMPRQQCRCPRCTRHRNFHSHGPIQGWNGMGSSDIRICWQYVGNLEPLPTTIVMNACLWPHVRLSKRLTYILRAATDMNAPATHTDSRGNKAGRGSATHGHKQQGHRPLVIWRGIVTERGMDKFRPSTADLIVQHQSIHRIPNVVYQPFPQISSVNLGRTITSIKTISCNHGYMTNGMNR